MSAAEVDLERRCDQYKDHKNMKGFSFLNRTHNETDDLT